jgi:predicted component of type VI protein secretion system
VAAPAAPNRGLAGVSGTQVLSPAEARGGAPRLSLVINGARHRVAPGVSVLGRSRESDIVIADPNVSRKHAEIRLVGQDWIVTDLGSTNGIEIEGRRVGRHALEDGEELVLGTAHVQVEID